MLDHVLFNSIFSAYLVHSKALDSVTLNVLVEPIRKKMMRALNNKRALVFTDILLDTSKNCDIESCPATNHDSLFFTCIKCNKTFCHRHVADIHEVDPMGIGKGMCIACLNAEKSILRSRIAFLARYLISELEHAHARGITTITRKNRMSEKISINDLIAGSISNSIDSSLGMFLLDDEALLNFTKFLLNLELVNCFPKLQALFQGHAVTRDDGMRKPFDAFSLLDDCIEICLTVLPHNQYLRDLRRVHDSKPFDRIVSALPSRNFEQAARPSPEVFGPRVIENIMKELTNRVRKGEYIGTSPPHLLLSFKPSGNFPRICRAYQRFMRLLAQWHKFHESMLKETIYHDIMHILLDDAIEFIKKLGPARLMTGILDRETIKYLLEMMASVIGQSLKAYGISIEFSLKGNESMLVVEPRIRENGVYTAGLTNFSIEIKDSIGSSIKTMDISELIYYLAFCGYPRLDNDKIIIEATPEKDGIGQVLGDWFPFLDDSLVELMNYLGGDSFAEFTSRSDIFKVGDGKTLEPNTPIFSRYLAQSDYPASVQNSPMFNSKDFSMAFGNAYVIHYIFPPFSWNLFPILLNILLNDVLAHGREPDAEERAACAGFILYMLQNLSSARSSLALFLKDMTKFTTSSISFMLTTIPKQVIDDSIKEFNSLTLLSMVEDFFSDLSKAWEEVLRYE